MEYFMECQKKEISLCIIDTSKQNYFKPKTSQKFLDIIKKIVDENLADGERFELSEPVKVQ